MCLWMPTREVRAFRLHVNCKELLIAWSSKVQCMALQPKRNKNNNNNKLKLSSTPLWPHSNEGNSTVVSISAVKSGPGFLTRAPVIRGAGGCGLSIKAICSRDHLQGTEATCWPLMIRTPTLSWSSGFLFLFLFSPTVTHSPVITHSKSNRKQTEWWRMSFSSSVSQSRIYDRNYSESKCTFYSKGLSLFLDHTALNLFIKKIYLLKFIGRKGQQRNKILSLDFVHWTETLWLISKPYVWETLFYQQLMIVFIYIHIWIYVYIYCLYAYILYSYTTSPLGQKCFSMETTWNEGLYK